jgi:hypothetical protein
VSLGRTKFIQCNVALTVSVFAHKEIEWLPFLVCMSCIVCIHDLREQFEESSFITSHPSYSKKNIGADSNKRLADVATSKTSFSNSSLSSALSSNPIFSIDPLSQQTSAARGALRGGASGYLGCTLLDTHETRQHN